MTGDEEKLSEVAGSGRKHGFLYSRLSNVEKYENQDIFARLKFLKDAGFEVEVDLLGSLASTPTVVWSARSLPLILMIPIFRLVTSTGWKVFYSVIAAVITALAYFALRHVGTNSQRTKKFRDALHKFTHLFRDRMVEAQILMSSGKSSRGAKFRDICDSLADQIKAIFEILYPGKDIKCSIRLLTAAKGKKKKSEVYYTFGSSGFSRKRERTLLPRDTGIAYFFDSYHGKKEGILYLIDKLKASKVMLSSQDGKEIPLYAFDKKNDDREEFRNEAKSFLVAPINGHDLENGSDMIGLLYVSSDEERAPFFLRHFKLLAAIADTLGIGMGTLLKCHLSRRAAR